MPQVVHELRHWLSVVSLVSQGLGVALVPQALQQSALAGAAFEADDALLEWADALDGFNAEGKPKFKDISDEIRPFVDKLFNKDGTLDYRSVSEQILDHAAVK
jgi:DNA-binding transcriptional LysR family regulator